MATKFEIVDGPSLMAIMFQVFGPGVSGARSDVNVTFWNESLGRKSELTLSLSFTGVRQERADEWRFWAASYNSAMTYDTVGDRYVGWVIPTHCNVTGLYDAATRKGSLQIVPGSDEDRHLQG